ncbi:MAG: O-antigen ligase family protein [Marinifilaceae bacterium]
MSLDKFREGGILTVIFALGSINILWDRVFYILMALSFFLNIIYRWKEFWQDIKAVRYYLYLPLIMCMYVLIHYAIVNIFHIDYYTPYKARWGIIENLLLFFTAVPVYLISCKPYVTSSSIKNAIGVFGVGVMSVNVGLFIWYYLTNSIPFSDYIELLYMSRFLGNKELWNATIYLEAHAFNLAVAAILVGYVALESVKPYRRVCALFLFGLLTVFLSFTVTKGSIFPFVICLIYLLIVKYKRLVHSNLVINLVIIGCFVYGAQYIVTSDIYVERMQTMLNEINGVINNKYVGDSIGPRLGILRECWDRIGEYGLWGVGVYSKDITQSWFVKSPYSIDFIQHVHNSFIDFWIIGGVMMLTYFLSLFILPIIRMVKRHEISHLILVILLFMFLANFATIFVRLADSKTLIMFLLSGFYLYTSQFYNLDKKRSMYGKNTTHSTE